MVSGEIGKPIKGDYRLFLPPGSEVLSSFGVLTQNDKL